MGPISSARELLCGLIVQRDLAMTFQFNRMPAEIDSPDDRGEHQQENDQANFGERRQACAAHDVAESHDPPPDPDEAPAPVDAVFCSAVADGVAGAVGGGAVRSVPNRCRYATRAMISLSSRFGYPPCLTRS